MELTGSTADRWEQMGNKINDLAIDVSAKQELIKGVSSTLEDLNGELDAVRKTLEQLRNLADKEVLREESGTLNDEAPVFDDVQNPEEKEDEKVEAASNFEKPLKEKKKNNRSNTKASEKPIEQAELFHSSEE